MDVGERVQLCAEHRIPMRNCLACAREICSLCPPLEDCRNQRACLHARISTLSNATQQFKSDSTGKFTPLLSVCGEAGLIIAPLQPLLGRLKAPTGKKAPKSKAPTDAMDFTMVSQVTEAIIELAASGLVLNEEMFNQISIELADLVGVEPVQYATWNIKQLCFAEGNEDKPQSDGKRLIKDVIADVFKFSQVAIDLIEDDEESSQPIRVYLMRDCFWPMVCDNLACIKQGKQPNGVGALISRRSFKIEFYDEEITRLFEQAARKKISGREALDKFMLEEISMLIDNDKDFSGNCDAIVEHLRLEGALKFAGKEPIVQSLMFVDTGYKTFPVLLKAILSKKHPGKITVSMLYHTVDPAFAFLPTSGGFKPQTEKKNAEIAGMNDLGSYASFLKAGASMQPSGELKPETVGHGHPQRLYNSVLVGLMAIMAVNEG